MTAIRPGWRTGAVAGLLAVGLAGGASGQAREDFANACAPLISLSTMTPPPGEEGNVVRTLQTITAGIAKTNADLIVSAYAEGARIQNFPRLLGDAGSPASREELRRMYGAYFTNVPEWAVVFTPAVVSVKESRATASARARFVLPPGSGRDTYNASVTWKLARGEDGWRITEERYQE